MMKILKEEQLNDDDWARIARLVESGFTWFAENLTNGRNEHVLAPQLDATPSHKGKKRRND